MFTLVQEARDWVLNRKSSIDTMYFFIYLTYSYLFLLEISFAFWMDHLILSKNQIFILKTMSHADSSCGFPVHKCAGPSFLEDLYKLSSSTFPALPIPKVFLANQPCPHMSIFACGKHPHSDQESALSLEGHSWQGSCFPFNTGNWYPRCWDQKQRKNTGWTNTTAAKHRNRGKTNSYKGQIIIAVLACKYMLDGKSSINIEKISWETRKQFAHRTHLITSSCCEEHNYFFKSKRAVFCDISLEQTTLKYKWKGYTTRSKFIQELHPQVTLLCLGWHYISSLQQQKRELKDTTTNDT